MTNFLTPAQVKKGETVVIFDIWNFHRNFPRETTQYCPKAGKRIPYTHTTDIYWMREYTVHSCGKVRMYLMGADGVTRGKEIGSRDGKFWFRVVRTKEEARAAIAEMNATDKFAAPAYEVSEEVAPF